MANQKVIYEWEAEEFNAQTGWSIWIWLLLIAIVGWAVWSRQWFLVATVAMVVVVVLLAKRMRPRKFIHQITEAGIMVGDKFVPYDKLVSFWIVLDDGARVVNILPNRKVGLVMTLQLGDANVDKVREALAKSLPEDASRGEDTVDKIGRFFRL